MLIHQFEKTLILTKLYHHTGQFKFGLNLVERDFEELCRYRQYTTSEIYIVRNTFINDSQIDKLPIKYEWSLGNSLV